jgi:hypothetical protein
MPYNFCTLSCYKYWNRCKQYELTAPKEVRNSKSKDKFGRAVDHAVSCWLPATAAQNRDQVK